MIISQDIPGNSLRFGVKHICKSHQLTLEPKTAKELAYPNALQTEKMCSKNERKLTRNNEQRNTNKGCNQFGLNGLRERVGTQGAS